MMSGGLASEIVPVVNLKSCAAAMFVPCADFASVEIVMEYSVVAVRSALGSKVSVASPLLHENIPIAGGASEKALSVSGFDIGWANPKAIWVGPGAPGGR